MLELNDFSAGYNRIKVVKDVYIKVDRDEIVALIGPNGAGKTTILKGIVGLAEILKGTVSVDGQDITGKPTEKIAQMGIILVPDDRRLFLNMSCEENLEIGAYLEDARRHFKDSLEVVYTLFPVLKEKRKQPAKTLSGGEQQMLAIARGIMARPKFLLIDEPSTGLSPKLVSSVLRTLGEMRGKWFSVLFAEQNAYAALEYSDRAYLMSKGEIMFNAPSSEMLRSKDLIKQYFGGLSTVASHN